MIVQAVWFKLDKWDASTSRKWCVDHDYSTDVVRSKKDGNIDTHLIYAQFDPSEAKDGTWRVLSDDLPDGVSFSICERKSMDIQHTKGVQSADDPFEFVMSSEDVDRMGDVIRAKGWELGDFNKNPIALWGHSHDKPIGVWENVRVVGKQLIGRLKLAKQGTSAEIDTIRSLVEQRILKSVSVGFQPLKAKPLEKSGGYEFLKQSLHECSLVAVPANQNALAIAKSFGADPAKIFGNDEGQLLAPEEIKKLNKHRPLSGGKLADVDSALERINKFMENR